MHINLDTESHIVFVPQQGPQKRKKRKGHYLSKEAQPNFENISKSFP